MNKPVVSQRRIGAPLSALSGLLMASLISACGGGGGDSPTPEPSPTPTPNALTAAQLQGRWLTAIGISPARTAIVLPASSSTSTELWLLANDLSSLSRLQISTSGTDGVSASGQTYSLPSSASTPGQSVAYSGSANLSNNSLSLNGGALLLTRSDDLKTPASQSAITGAWSASAGTQVITVTLNIAANGTLSGPSSTGCSYSGSVTARTDASAYNASVTETCSSGTTPFSGIGTYRAAQGSGTSAVPAALTLALTRTDATQTQALVLALQR